LRAQRAIFTILDPQITHFQCILHLLETDAPRSARPHTLEENWSAPAHTAPATRSRSMRAHWTRRAWIAQCSDWLCPCCTSEPFSAQSQAILTPPASPASPVSLASPAPTAPTAPTTRHVPLALHTPSGMPPAPPAPPAPPITPLSPAVAAPAAGAGPRAPCHVRASVRTLAAHHKRRPKSRARHARTRRRWRPRTPMPMPIAPIPPPSTPPVDAAAAGAPVRPCHVGASGTA
jgi:hypothetical protein